MLHRRRTGELVGAGERVPHPYSPGDSLIVSRWERTPRPRKRKRDPVEYDTIVFAYRMVDGTTFIGWDEFAPHELGLVWKDDENAIRSVDSVQ